MISEKDKCIAIMQPYFLPYIGYFSLINISDEFILFDTPQYMRHSWIERNRILKLDGEPNYIKVALKKTKQTDSINTVCINNSINWKGKIFGQLTHYKKKAPYYTKVINLLEVIFQTEYDSITKLNLASLTIICDYLGIHTPIKIWSEMDLEIDSVNAPDEWALNICKACNANKYINAIGGKTFFEKEKYSTNNIELKFLEQIPKPYKQFTNEFVPFLSIIDVMMFCSVMDIRKMLNLIICK
ncbi:WbqC family protein [Nonlabens dokdonensis]|uniref:WbqC family protein n=1 Tax=Nonlabens dokdonensis TaxID=328515 RepID=UPI0026F27D79|nr:WbqC family protein [Nonlabens dokdonensis]